MSQKKNPDEYQYGKPCEDHIGNKFKTIKVMCEQYGIPYSTYQARKKQGWELARILTTPPKNYSWHSPHRNMGIPMTKAEKKKYKGYEETPGSRVLLTYEGKYKEMAEQFRKDEFGVVIEGYCSKCGRKIGRCCD